MLAATLAFALLQSAAPAPAQERPQEGGIMGPYVGVQERAGPLHFCGESVAIDVAADERVAWQEGPDFDLYFLRSSRGFGLYEGNHPDRGDGRAEPVTISGLPAQRMRGTDGVSYLVQVGDASFPTFVHFYGRVWQGDARDDALLARVRIGQPAALGCAQPTFQR